MRRALTWVLVVVVVIAIPAEVFAQPKGQIRWTTPDNPTRLVLTGPRIAADCEVIRFEDLAKPSPYWEVGVLSGTLKSIEKAKPEWVGTEIRRALITVAVDEVFFNRTGKSLLAGSNIVFAIETDFLHLFEEDVEDSPYVEGSRVILMQGEQGSTTDDIDGTIGLAPWDFFIAPDLTSPSTEVSGCISLVVHGMSESLDAMTVTMEKVLKSHPSMAAGTSYQSGGSQISGEIGHSSLWSFARDAIDTVFTAIRESGG